jgi:hypothetical protein
MNKMLRRIAILNIFFLASILFSCLDILIGKAVLKPIYPEDEKSINTTYPALIWQPIEGAALYHVQVSSERDFSAAPYIDFSGVKNNYVQLNKSLKDEPEWFWRIKFKDSKGEWSKWSSVNSFRIEKNEKVPELLVVKDRNEFSKETALEWVGIDSTSKYHLQISEVPDLSEPIIDDMNVLSTKYRIKQELDKTAYFWRIRAFGKDGNWEDWSGIWILNLETGEGPGDIVEEEESTVDSRGFETDYGGVEKEDSPDRRDRRDRNDRRRR